jgi:hypothetical protein
MNDTRIRAAAAAADDARSLLSDLCDENPDIGIRERNDLEHARYYLNAAIDRLNKTIPVPYYPDNTA